MVDRRDRPCLDPLKRDSGRYAITLISTDRQTKGITDKGGVYEWRCVRALF